MSTQPLLLTELNAWFEGLGPVFHDKAREDFRKLYGSSSTPGELMSFMVATYGTERIKDVWRQIYATAVASMQKPSRK